MFVQSNCRELLSTKCIYSDFFDLHLFHLIKREKFEFRKNSCLPGHLVKLAIGLVLLETWQFQHNLEIIMMDD